MFPRTRTTSNIFLVVPKTESTYKRKQFDFYPSSVSPATQGDHTTKDSTSKPPHLLNSDAACCRRQQTTFFQHRLEAGPETPKVCRSRAGEPRLAKTDKERNRNRKGFLSQQNFAQVLVCLVTALGISQCEFASRWTEWIPSNSEAENS